LLKNIFEILLSYEKPWWDETLESLHVISRISNREELIQNIKHQFSDQRANWWESICEFEPSHGNDNVLLLWMSGSSYHEEMSDQEISQGCTQVLRKFLSRNDIPEPKQVFRSKWNSEPLFKGAYSYLSLSATKNDNSNLAEPIKLQNVIIFLQ
jgi:hypothetical protein